MSKNIYKVAESAAKLQQPNIQKIFDFYKDEYGFKTIQDAWFFIHQEVSMMDKYKNNPTERITVLEQLDNYWGLIFDYLESKFPIEKFDIAINPISNYEETYPKLKIGVYDADSYDIYIIRKEDNHHAFLHKFTLYEDLWKNPKDFEESTLKEYPDMCCIFDNNINWLTNAVNTFNSTAFWKTNDDVFQNKLVDKFVSIIDSTSKATSIEMLASVEEKLKPSDVIDTTIDIDNTNNSSTNMDSVVENSVTEIDGLESSPNVNIHHNKLVNSNANMDKSATTNSINSAQEENYDEEMVELSDDFIADMDKFGKDCDDLNNMVWKYKFENNGDNSNANTIPSCTITNQNEQEHSKTLSPKESPSLRKSNKLKNEKKSQWEPNFKIDLSSLLTFIQTDKKFFSSTFLTSCGFKDGDQKTKTGDPIMVKLSPDKFLEATSLYKEIQINKNEMVRAIAFDVDMDYNKFAPILEKLILNEVVPAPSFIVTRLSSKHSHLVYLLDKRYTTRFRQTKILVEEIKSHFQKAFDSDKGFNNSFIHNPFYEYINDKKEYFSSDKDGYVTHNAPVLNHLGKEPSPDKLDLNIYRLDDLAHFAQQVKNNKYIKEFEDNIEQMFKHQDGRYKVDNNELNIKLNEAGSNKYDSYTSRFPTGPEYRNNTLFYNGLAYANKDKLKSEESIYKIIERAAHYLNSLFPKSHPIKDSEIRSIAKSVWKIHNNNRNYVYAFRSWDNSEYYYDVMTKTMRYLEISHEFKTFSERQQMRGKLSGAARKAIQVKRQKELCLLLENGKWKGLNKTKLKEEAAKHFRVSTKTIERDLTELRNQKEQRFLSFEYYIETIKKVNPLLTVGKRMWHQFILWNKPPQITRSNDTAFHENVAISFKDFILSLKEIQKANSLAA